MKHQKATEKIQAGGYTRAELVKLRANAESLVKKEDLDAKEVVSPLI
jgi:hypothetical protein